MALMPNANALMLGLCIISSRAVVRSRLLTIVSSSIMRTLEVCTSLSAQYWAIVYYQIKDVLKNWIWYLISNWQINVPGVWVISKNNLACRVNRGPLISIMGSDNIRIIIVNYFTINRCRYMLNTTGFQCLNCIMNYFHRLMSHYERSYVTRIG